MDCFLQKLEILRAGLKQNQHDELKGREIDSQADKKIQKSHGCFSMTCHLFI
ncbi:MAG: hypothetical protein HUJ54_12860 [Erysipelotrichaceae bacterium]|nr:hypothetical protein [Erysipelotrichaceae bacterium]